MAAFGAGQRLILENEEKAPCDCLTGAKLPNELQVVFLQDTAARILLMLQLPADGIQVPVNVRTLCQCLELHLDRGDFQIGNKGVNDAALLSRAAQQEVDGNYFYSLDIAVISCINDAVLNLLDRDIVRQGIERLNGFFLLQEGLELRHAALLQINRKSAAAFGERRIFCFAVAFPLLREPERKELEPDHVAAPSADILCGLVVEPADHETAHNFGIGPVRPQLRRVELDLVGIVRQRDEGELADFAAPLRRVDLDRERVFAVSFRRRELDRVGAERIARQIQLAERFAPARMQPDDDFAAPGSGRQILPVRLKRDGLEDFAVPVGAVDDGRSAGDFERRASGMSPAGRFFRREIDSDLSRNRRGFRSGLRHRRKHEIFHFGFAFIGIDLNRERVFAVSCRRREFGRSGVERIAREVEPGERPAPADMEPDDDFAASGSGQFIAQVRRQNNRFERLAVPVGAVQRQHAGVDLQFGAFGFAPFRRRFRREIDRKLHRYGGEAERRRQKRRKRGPSEFCFHPSFPFTQAIC